MYVLGIDIGTSCAKCLLITRDGQVAGRASEAYPLLVPRPGWAEQDPEWWVEAAFDSIRKLIETTGISAEEIEGISFSGQMHGLVSLDRDGRVIRKAFLWCDQRTEAQCREIEEKAGGRESLLEMTNNVMLAGYTGGKLIWMRQEEPEAFRRMVAFLCPKDYLRYRMTGERGMDVTEASGTGLFDTRRRQWCEPLIHALGLDMNLFPPTMESTALAGYVTPEAAERTGLRAGTPCFAGGGDAVVQSFGSGLIREGRAGTVIGTAGNVSMGFEWYTPNPGGKLQAFCGVTPGSYMSFGSTQTAGGALRWFRDELCRDIQAKAELEAVDAFDMMAAEAEQSVPGAGGIVFAPYLSGERCPWPDAAARGVLYGLSLNTTRADMIRAVMEGIVYSLRQIVEIYRSFTRVDSLAASGGGAKSALFLRLQADIIGVPVVTLSAASEGGAYGAALIAGMGTGWYRSAEEAVSILKTEREIRPDLSGRTAYENAFELYSEIYPALKDVFRRGAEREKTWRSI
ncbi:MAG: xylulokinase [Clostridia bacterium]|nr:xylulokinase [Clostridia bacterium]